MALQWKRSSTLEKAERLSELREMVEARLRVLLPQDGKLEEAMRYSLTAGGKRLRPILALEFCRVCGGEPATVLDAACGIEMLHTYSLIHDDLPCMDNDVLRRGKPTNHVVYGEWLALLAGDALQAEAFRALLDSALSTRAKLRAASVLARAAGRNGICGGQYLDLFAQGRALPPEQHLSMYEQKTAALFEASCVIGCLAAASSEKQVEAARSYGNALGLAFQLRDDLLDAESTEEELGKPIGSDARNGKNTLAMLLGREETLRRIREATEAADALLCEQFEGDEFLRWLTAELVGRKS